MEITPESIRLYRQLAKQVTYLGSTMPRFTPKTGYSPIDKVLEAWSRGNTTLIDRLLGYPVGVKKAKRGLGKRTMQGLSE